MCPVIRYPKSKKNKAYQPKANAALLKPAPVPPHSFRCDLFSFASGVDSFYPISELFQNPVRFAFLMMSSSPMSTQLVFSFPQVCRDSMILTAVFSS